MTVLITDAWVMIWFPSPLSLEMFVSRIKPQSIEYHNTCTVLSTFSILLWGTWNLFTIAKLQYNQNWYVNYLFSITDFFYYNRSHYKWTGLKYICMLIFFHIINGLYMIINTDIQIPPKCINDHTLRSNTEFRQTWRGFHS